MHVYTSREAIDSELGGLNAITGILDAYRKIMLLTTGEFLKLSDKNNIERLSVYPIDSLLYSLLPEKHKQAYNWSRSQNAALEPIYRTQLVVDYVAGMTDSHALTIFNMINGSQQFAIE